MKHSTEKKILKLSEDASTPFYCYFAEKIKDNFRLLQSVFPSEFKILYSLKANSNSQLVNYLATLGAGFDVTSLEELVIAIGSGKSVQHISYTGPGKTEAEIKQMLRKKIGYINIESRDELKFICEQQELTPDTHLLLRIAWPEDPTQFGMDSQDILDAIKHRPAFKLEGIHAFRRSQILDQSKLIEHFRKTLELAISLRETHGFNIRYLNFGSGLGIPYFEGEKELDLESFSINLKSLLDELNVEERLPSVHFLVESGRFLVGEAGYYVVKVLYTKKVHGKKIAIVDGGLHQFMAATGMGQIIKRPFSIFKPGAKEGLDLERITIAGKSCSPQDIFASDLELPRLQAGDYLCIGNAGAYGLSYSPVHFSRHSCPDEFFIME